MPTPGKAIKAAASTPKSGKGEIASNKGTPVVKEEKASPAKVMKTPLNKPKVNIEKASTSVLKSGLRAPHERRNTAKASVTPRVPDGEENYHESEGEEEEYDEKKIAEADAGNAADFENVAAWTPNVDRKGEPIDTSHGRSEITVVLARKREKATKQDPNGRVPGRKLVPWHRPRMMEKLLLALQYECKLKGIELPWDDVVHRINPGSSGPSALQHLSKARGYLACEGHMIPPPLYTECEPTIRGFVRDMEVPVIDNVAHLKIVTWDEELEHPKTSLEVPGVVVGSGNYQRKAGGRDSVGTGGSHKSHPPKAAYDPRYQAWLAGHRGTQSKIMLKGRRQRHNSKKAKGAAVAKGTSVAKRANVADVDAGNDADVDEVDPVKEDPDEEYVPKTTKKSPPQATRKSSRKPTKKDSCIPTPSAAGSLGQNEDNETPKPSRIVVLPLSSAALRGLEYTEPTTPRSHTADASSEAEDADDEDFVQESDVESSSGEPAEGGNVNEDNARNDFMGLSKHAAVDQSTQALVEGSDARMSDAETEYTDEDDDFMKGVAYTGRYVDADEQQLPPNPALNNNFEHQFRLFPDPAFMEQDETIMDVSQPSASWDIHPSFVDSEDDRVAQMFRDYDVDDVIQHMYASQAQSRGNARAQPAQRHHTTPRAASHQQSGGQPLFSPFPHYLNAQTAPPLPDQQNRHTNDQATASQAFNPGDGLFTNDKGLAQLPSWAVPNQDEHFDYQENETGDFFPPADNPSAYEFGDLDDYR